MDDTLLAEGRAVARRLNHTIRLTIPSILATNETFAMRITVFGPDSLPAGDLEADLVFTDSIGVEGLPQKLRLSPADGGLVTLPGLEAVGPAGAIVRAEVGGYPIASNPAWVAVDSPYRLYWGDLHVHTTVGECQTWSCKSPEFAYAYARDVARLDFAAAADHIRGIHKDMDRWDRLQRLTAELEAPGLFIPVLCYESSHKVPRGGDNNVYFRDTEGAFFWLDRDDMKTNNPDVPVEDLWAFLDEAGGDYMTIPHHTGRRTKYRAFDTDTYDPARERLFEITSAWGCSERRHTPMPLHDGNTDEPAYFVDALKAGCRYGVIASSDDHTTLPGGVSRNWGAPYAGHGPSGYGNMGLAAVRAKDLTREALWDAMWNRRTYGTTLARTLVEMRVGDLEMGAEGTVGAGDALRHERRIAVRYSSTSAVVQTVTLMRNGEALATKRFRFERDAENGIVETEFTDTDDLAEVAIKGARFHPDPFVVYYVRVEDPKSNTQWTSPVWLDLA